MTRVCVLLTTNQTSQLKSEDTQQKDVLHRKIFERFAPERLGCSNRKEHGSAIPSNIAEAVKVARNIRDSSRYDSLMSMIPD